MEIKLNSILKKNIIEPIISNNQKKKSTKISKLESDKMWLEQIILREMSKKDIANYNAMNNVNHNRIIDNDEPLSEYQIKMDLLKENKDLYLGSEIERFCYLKRYILHESLVVRTSIKDVFDDVKRDYKRIDLNNVLVQEIAKRNMANDLKNIAYAYKLFCINKNRELLGEEYYFDCISAIEGWIQDIQENEQHQNEGPTLKR